MNDVTAFGEILIDFTPAGFSENGALLFERNPGGAPANVAVCISRLGGNTSFIGKVGKDIFGDFLLNVLVNNNVDASGLKFSLNYNTTLAFVQLDENGDRSFSFYRNPGADTSIEQDEIDLELIKNTKVLHFGSLSLTDEPARSTTLFLLNKAKENGVVISYDPNLRPLLWKSLEEARERIVSVLKFTDILKVSEEELEFITSNNNIEEATAHLSDRYGIGTVLVTMGSRGSFFRTGGSIGRKPTFQCCKAVDTTGAGDAFMGGFLYKMLYSCHPKPCWHDYYKTEKAVVFANAVASLCVTRRGAIPAMPSLTEVEELLLKASGT